MKYDNIKAWKELMPSLKLLTDAVNEEFKANLKALFEENETH